MERTIRHEWFYPHRPNVVWEYLTDPILLQEWLMPNDFQPRVGHEFKFKTLPKPRFGFDGNIYCQVLEVVPSERLTYSWKGGWGGKITLDSKVTWTLTAKDDGTLLLLEHSGFQGMKNIFSFLVMNKGWVKIIKRLLSVIQKQTV
ncbi:SRPBCC family protein [Chitinophaga lutea]